MVGIAVSLTTTKTSCVIPQAEQAGLGMDGFGKWKWAGESVTGQRAWYGIARFLFTSLPKQARLSAGGLVDGWTLGKWKWAEKVSQYSSTYHVSLLHYQNELACRESIRQARLVDEWMLEQAGLGDGWTFGKWKWAGESVTGQRAWYGIARFLFTSLPKRARLSRILQAGCWWKEEH
ncbi:hypothetical protein J6590_043192 [Homalodisca vitripennis]|nr:hypothetical protein J6590_043192 [Homalodisca vitripennis]